MAILTDLKDPRVNNVTVTFVEVSADLRHAKVHVSVMGDEKKQELCLKGLAMPPDSCSSGSAIGSIPAIPLGSSLF